VGTTSGYNGIDEIMPFSSPVFPEHVTPRSVFHIISNKMIDMNYRYSRHRFPGLISQNRQGCHWDWFEISWPKALAESSKKLDKISQMKELEQQLKNAREEDCKEMIAQVPAIEAVMENEKDGVLHLSGALTLGYIASKYNSEQVIGLRFALDLPYGVTIKEARLSFIASSNSSYLLYLKIQSEEKVNSTSYLDMNYLSGRSVFSKSIPWNIRYPWRENENVMSPNISNLLESIDHLEEWANRGIIGIIIRSIQSQPPNFRTVLSDLNSIILTVRYCA